MEFTDLDSFNIENGESFYKKGMGWAHGIVKERLSNLFDLGFTDF